jgi:hypothetical protein
MHWQQGRTIMADRQRKRGGQLRKLSLALVRGSSAAFERSTGDTTQGDSADPRAHVIQRVGEVARASAAQHESAAPASLKTDSRRIDQAHLELPREAQHNSASKHEMNASGDDHVPGDERAPVVHAHMVLLTRLGRSSTRVVFF